MINVLIPMAGLGSRFSKEGYIKPKPFIDVDGKPMIVRVIENLNIDEAKYILIARNEHLEQEKELVKKITNKYNVVFIGISLTTEGAACTTLFAQDEINSDVPLLIANSDQLIDIDINDFINDSKIRSYDGSMLTFKSNDIKWSYAKLDDGNNVIEVKEKVVISDNATVGIYYFSKGSHYIKYAIQMIINNDRTNNEFYVCPIYNYFIKDNKKIGIYTIKESEMHGIGTPNDLKIYLKEKYEKISYR